MSEFNEEKLADCEKIKQRLKKVIAGKKVSENPKVSIVIPTYKNASFIAETLESVFAQTFKNYEIILVNDGSPDTAELEKVLQPLADRIIYVEQENLGPSRARNSAICLARGELISFLDGDDIWLPEFLESQIERLETENADMIYCDAFLFGAPFYEGKKFSDKSPSNGKVTTESLIGGGCSVITSTTVLRKKILEKSGLFDTSLRGMEDFDLWFRLLKSGAKITFQKKLLAKYRKNPAGLSGSELAIAERSIAAMNVIKAKHEFTPNERKIREARMREFVAHEKLERGKKALAENRFEDAKKYLSETNEISRNLKVTLFADFSKARAEAFAARFDDRSSGGIRRGDSAK